MVKKNKPVSLAIRPASMATHKVPEEEILDSLTGLFREYGYDGTSLSRVMEATGLAKASLYHRFTGGKEEMAIAVMDRVSEEFVSRILAPLTGAGEAGERIRETGRRLWEFYGGGRKACLLDTLTVSRGSAVVEERAKGSLGVWIGSFARFAEEWGGMPPGLARRRAQDAIAAIEGGLIVARVSGDHGPFLRAIDQLPGWLLSGNEGKEESP